MTKTLVTGATGFIGRNLVEALLAQGRSIRVLVKPDSDYGHFKKIENIEVAYGDLTKKETLLPAVNGINIVYHLGAVLPYNYESEKTYFRVNVEGTKNLLEACSGHDIRKFIYFSSISAVGPQYKPIAVQEDFACNPLTHYGKSKYLSEKIALDFFREKSFPVVILRSPMVYGPGDTQGLLRIFKLAQKRLLILAKPMCDKIRSFCYVGNLIAASLKVEAAQRASGNIYFIADREQYRLQEFIEAISRELGVKLLRIQLPLSLCKMIGMICEMKDKLLNNKPFVTRELIKRLSSEYEICDISKAQSQLDYFPRYSLSEGLAQTILWYKQKRLLD